MLGMTVHEMLAKLSRAELIEWMAYFQLEPWGSRMDDQRFGVVAATMANVMSSGSGKTFSSVDFFPPKSEQERHILKQKQIDDTLRNFAAIHNRKIS